MASCVNFFGGVGGSIEYGLQSGWDNSGLGPCELRFLRFFFLFLGSGLFFPQASRVSLCLLFSFFVFLFFPSYSFL